MYQAALERLAREFAAIEEVDQGNCRGAPRRYDGCGLIWPDDKAR